MESGNSSSIQSSSGGAGGGVGVGVEDEEYESNSGNNNYYHNSTTTPQQPPPYQYHPSMQQFMFQTNNPQLQLPPISLNQNYLDTLNDQTNYQNLMFWEQTQPPPQQQPQPQTTISSTIINNPLPPPASSNKPSTSSGPGKGPSTSSGSGQKNPRKRTRASRRAPTTVLTTDTSNFRAMVQEFTGIPSSPFCPAVSPLLSRRLTDLFTGPGTVRPSGLVGGAGGYLERLLGGFSNTGNNYNYPFRPSAHKPLINNNPSLLMTNLPLSSSSVSTTTMMRYNSLGGLLSGDDHTTGAHFQDLSGILGNHNHHHEMFLSSTNNVTGGNDAFSLPQHMVGGGGGGGSSSGAPWQGGPTSVPSNDDNNNVSNNNIDGNNNESNQHLEGTISGSGTTNYDSNLNVIVSRDNAPPPSSNAQGVVPRLATGC